MYNLKQWVCCKADSKIPFRADGKGVASCSDSDTWASYEEAKNAGFDNVGFVFNNNDIVGIDIDCGFDKDGFLSQVSVEIMNACRSYTERSRSGRGIHIYVRGKLPFDGKNNRCGVEIYQKGRYFIYTGEKIIFDKVIENQAGINHVLDTYFPETKRTVLVEKRINQCFYQPTYKSPKNGRIFLHPEYPLIQNGVRNLSLTSLAGQLKTYGYSKKQIYEELLQVNWSACKPRLADNELVNITNSIWRYQ